MEYQAHRLNTTGELSTQTGLRVLGTVPNLALAAEVTIDFSSVPWAAKQRGKPMTLTAVRTIRKTRESLESIINAPHESREIVEDDLPTMQST